MNLNSLVPKLGSISNFRDLLFRFIFLFSKWSKKCSVELQHGYRDKKAFRAIIGARKQLEEQQKAQLEEMKTQVAAAMVLRASRGVVRYAWMWIRTYLKAFENVKFCCDLLKVF